MSNDRIDPQFSDRREPVITYSRVSSRNPASRRRKGTQLPVVSRRMEPSVEAAEIPFMDPHDEADPAFATFPPELRIDPLDASPALRHRRSGPMRVVLLGAGVAILAGVGVLGASVMTFIPGKAPDGAGSISQPALVATNATVPVAELVPAPGVVREIPLAREEAPAAQAAAKPPEPRPQPAEETASREAQPDRPPAASSEPSQKPVTDFATAFPDPAPVKPAPSVANADPTPVKPAPNVAKADPTPVKPAPTVAKADPTPVKPAPAVAKADPAPAKPMAKATSETATSVKPKPEPKEGDALISSIEATLAKVDSTPTGNPAPEPPVLPPPVAAAPQSYPPIEEECPAINGVFEPCYDVMPPEPVMGNGYAPPIPPEPIPFPSTGASGATQPDQVTDVDTAEAAAAPEQGGVVSRTVNRAVGAVSGVLSGGRDRDRDRNSRGSRSGLGGLGL